MLKAFVLLWTLFSFVACADGPPADTPSEVPAPDTTVRESIVQDQIEYTREQTPEAPVEDAPPPTIASAPAPPVAPPPPTNSAPATIASAVSTPAPTLQGPSHAAFTELLSRHVSNTGAVDYPGFLREMDDLNAYLATLARETPGSSWSQEETLAYWINAYNAFTIKLILDNWPVKSIREIEEPWDQTFITLDGQQYSLNQIEHEIIRPNFDEPRIHFALVCAAVSCPPLATTAYSARQLDRQLEERTNAFINNEEFNVTQEEVVRVSPLFDWYAEDFGDVTAFLNRYLRTDIPAGKQLYFLEYDWALND